MTYERMEEDMFAEAEDRADEFYASRDFCLEDILVEQAKTDADKINRDGKTTGEATDFFHGWLKQITEDPLLHCYHAGRQFWEAYCKLVRSGIASEERAKLAIFPEW